VLYGIATNERDFAELGTAEREARQVITVTRLVLADRGQYLTRFPSAHAQPSARERMRGRY
jgi:hypothetical protein